MTEYKEVTESIEIPKNTGVDGFMLTIRKILALPKVQTVHINASGRVKYTRIVREEEDSHPLEMDFTTVHPSAIIRNNDLQEVEMVRNPTQGVARLFERVSMEHLFPIAWVSGPGSTFWLWHQSDKLSMSVARDEAYGLPFLYDELIPSSTLILCTGYTRSSALIDTKKSFKMLMPEDHQLLGVSHE